jgi:hypothetical protein
MGSQRIVTFQNALDIIESLPESQQESLIDIINRRLVEHKRDLLVKNVKKAREEYHRGEIKTGSVDDLMKEILE